MSSTGQSEIKVPALGESIREATVARWLKSEGDSVKADEVLVELETDKVTLEVNAPATGILTDVRLHNGSTVVVGDVLGLIAHGLAAQEERPSAPREKVETKLADLKIGDLKTAMSSMISSVAHKIESTVQKAATSEAVPPSVRKLAEELAINPLEVQGTGKARARYQRRHYQSFRRRYGIC